jgi:hypothetical protein
VALANSKVGGHIFITGQRSLTANLQVTASTTIENFDPQTRIFLINYSVKGENKHLTLQLSEDGNRLKVLNINRTTN